MVSSRKILIVEDEMLIAMDLQKRLEGLGHEIVSHAASGETAIHAAHETTPNLVFMDIGLKGKMDGLQAGITIHDSLAIPVVFCTAYSMLVDNLQKTRQGSFLHLPKPFSDFELEETLSHALKMTRP